MSLPAASLPSKVAELIEQKRFEELEDLWTQRMEEAPEDLAFFFSVAAAAKKKGSPSNALAWLRFLADYQAERGDQDARLAVLLEIARMSPTDPDVRGELEEALRVRFAAHPSLAAVLGHHPLGNAVEPAQIAGRAERWLRFEPGQIHYMEGHGPGRVVELNPALDVVRMEFSGGRLPLSLVSAERNLTALPPEHFLRRKLEDPEAVKSLLERDPAEAVRLLLESFGRPLTVPEIKAHLAGLVEEARWSSFWAAARRNPQLLLSGSGKSAEVAWSSSAGAAEETIRQSFEQADAARKMEIARKHAKRSKDLTRFFAEGLASEARRAAGDKPGLAWELSQAAVRLVPEGQEAFPASELLAAGDPLSLLAQVHDQAARQKAMEAVRESRADWADLFAEQFQGEEDARVLTSIFDALGSAPERRQELVRRIFRSPRVAPRAFLWLAERVHAGETPTPPNLFTALTDALRQEEFSAHRARVKEFFGPGSLTVSLARSVSSEEEAREYLNALNRAPNLEEHRRATVREALLMKFPDLRAPAREYLYATPEAIEARRQELARLRQVDLPANAEAMRAAKEHGDLSENFEYHAARQRHEYLSARIAALADELSRTRALEPSRIDVSEVRVGTRVVLREVASGAERTATILGPWDSRPEESIYSYESEFAQKLLGRRVGDRADLAGSPLEVVSIAPWR